MSVGLLVFSGYCCQDETAKAKNEWENSCTRSKAGQFIEKFADRIFLTEVAVGIAAFVLGLLSVLSVVAIPAAAGYAMIGVGAFILTINIAALILAVKVDPKK